MIIFLLLNSIVGFGQSNVVLVNELEEKEGVYLYNGIRFSGSGFLKGSNGQFIAEETYQNGKLHGKRICYNSRGKILSKEKFKEGAGKMKSYYTNEKLKSEGLFDNGNRVGLWVFFSARGEKKAEELWGEDGLGELMWEKYYGKYGALESEMTYKKGKLYEEKYYNEQGKVYKSNTYD